MVRSIKPKNNKAEIPSQGEWRNAFIGFFLVVILVVCSVIYIGKMNMVATRGFEIKKIEAIIAKEQEVSQQLKIESAQLKAISGLKESIDKLDMIKVSKVDYISGGGSTAMAR